MSKWLCPGVEAVTVAQGATRYSGLSGGIDTATEAQVQHKMRASYTASNLFCYVSSITGTLTVRDRKNGANGGQSILSITGSGQHEDTTNSTSLANGDFYCFQYVMSNSHGNTATCSIGLGTLLDDAGGNYSHIGTVASIGFDTTALYFDFGCGNNTDTTEANVQRPFEFACTLSKLGLYVSSNTFSASTTWRVRKNGANGNVNISLTAGDSGYKEDTTNSDSISVGDDVCLTKASGGTSGTALVTLFELHCAGGATTYSGGGWSTSSASTTTYGQYGGSTSGTSSEASTDVKVRVADTFRKLSGYVSSNTRTTSTTLTLRKSAADTSVTCSWGNSETGLKQDLSNSTTTVTTDEINVKLVTGTGTGNYNLEWWSIQQGAGTANVEATPGVGALTVTGLAPTVFASDHKNVLPGTGALTVTGFAPTAVVDTRVLPGTGDLTVTGLAPTVTATANTNVAPDVGALTVAGSAPTVAATAHVFTTPGTGDLTVTGFAPTINIGTIVSPGVGALDLNGFAPTVIASDNKVLTPGVGSLSASGYEPLAEASDHQIELPDVGILTLTGFAPTINIGTVAQPGVGALTIEGFAPTIATPVNLTPGVGALTIEGFAPTASISTGTSVTPGTGALTIEGFAPTLTISSTLHYWVRIA